MKYVCLLIYWNKFKKKKFQFQSNVSFMRYPPPTLNKH